MRPSSQAGSSTGAREGKGVLGYARPLVSGSYGGISEFQGVALGFPGQDRNPAALG